MRQLVAGERLAVDGDLSLVVDDAGPPLGLALIAVDRARDAVTDFAPIDSGARELRPGAQFVDEARLTVRLAEVPGIVERLILVAFGTGGAPLKRLLALHAPAFRFAVDLAGRGDAAVILIELYRHAGGWRLAANGQGFAHGLVAIAAAHRVDVGWARRLSGGETRDHAPPRSRGSGESSGSGVAIDRHHVLSNAHVVEDASRITVLIGGRPTNADLVFADPRNDLALLRVDAELGGAARFRPGFDLHLGEDIVVLGFPLQGLLGTGPQASAGNIAALCGIGNDSSVFQFTAPIASGNSGGPVLDMAGHLVGLVSSSLDLDRLRQAGNNAQNINFAIKGAIIRSFLDAFGVVPQSAADAAPIAPSIAQSIGRAAVVRQARETICRITALC